MYKATARALRVVCESPDGRENGPSRGETGWVVRAGKSGFTGESISRWAAPIESYVVGYILSPLARADFFNELLTQDTTAYARGDPLFIRAWITTSLDIRYPSFLLD